MDRPAEHRGRRAVFLDRDGVLVDDVGPLARIDDAHVRPEVPRALALLRDAGYLLVVVSNQTVVARGLLDEGGVVDLERAIEGQIVALGGPALDGFYFCPHHPSATLIAYRKDCECRKPKSGLLLRAARERDIELAQSFLVGDRPSDIAAGKRAGCTCVLVTTGRHADRLIETSEAFSAMEPDAVAADLAGAAELIVASGRP